MKRALCIGINDYPGTENDLEGCVNDAKDWSNALSARMVSIHHFLGDSSATRDGILYWINDLISFSEKGDTAIITYSGHGSFVPDQSGDEPDKMDECLCPYDVVENGPILDDELNIIFSRIPSSIRCVFISDSCHSGTVSKMMPILTPPATKAKSSPQRTIRFLPPSHFLPKRMLRSFAEDAVQSPDKWKDTNDLKVLLMSGCQDWEYSYDAWFNGRPNGAFTRVALLALAEMSSAATYYNWFRAIRKMLPSRQYPQTPNMLATSVMKRWKIFE